VITIKDAKGCIATDTAIVNEPIPIVSQSRILFNYNGEDIKCNGDANGQAEVTLSGGGVPPLIYEWDYFPPNDTKSRQTCKQLCLQDAKFQEKDLKMSTKGCF